MSAFASRITALDVALLLPPESVAELTRLNARLSSPSEGFQFDSGHLPHVTLAQQFVLNSEINVICNKLKHLANQYAPIRLCCSGLVASGATTSLRITESEQLFELHERIMNTLEAHVTQPGDAQAFFHGSETARHADIAWVNNFRNHSSGCRFEPHITVGKGTLDSQHTALIFSTSTLAACHLGKFCTCRHVFDSWSLTKTP